MNLNVHGGYSKSHRKPTWRVKEGSKFYNAIYDELTIRFLAEKL